jgi:hypothetical protein
MMNAAFCRQPFLAKQPAQQAASISTAQQAAQEAAKQITQHVAEHVIQQRIKSQATQETPEQPSHNLQQARYDAVQTDQQALDLNQNRFD